MRRLLPALLAVCALVLLAAASAQASALLPPAGKVLAGVGGSPTLDGYDARTAKHPAVFQTFTSWGTLPKFAFDRADAAGALPMLHIGTWDIAGNEVTSVGAIARGAGDDYLVGLNRLIAERGRPTYIRLMAEMDAYWNPYCAFDARGRSRGRDHSTAAFRAAWRRTVLVVRGGAVADIDRRLRALHQPPLRSGADSLARVPVAFQWVPQVAGAPDTRANSPRAYWPGAAYVDWVGTDFYSKFPNFRGLESFYRAFGGKPFVFGEWAMWGRDDPGFVRRLFAWVRSHPRVRMLIYNQGKRVDGPFRLVHYPRATRALRAALASGRFL